MLQRNSCFKSDMLSDGSLINQVMSTSVREKPQMHCSYNYVHINEPRADTDQCVVCPIFH